MKRDKNAQFANLPPIAADYIRLVIKKMGYRRKVREDVQAELIAHFEDALTDCKDDKAKEEKTKKLIEEFGDAKLLGILARRAKKRCRPMWRTAIARFFQTIGILVICLIIYCIYLSMGKPTISVNYVQRTEEMARPVVDESLNAAPLYQKAFELYVKEPNITKEEEPIMFGMRGLGYMPSDSNQSSSQKKPFTKTGTVKRSLLNVIGDKQDISSLTSEEFELLKRWIVDNNDALEVFKQATDKPYCWWNREAKNNVMFALLLPGLSDMRNFGKLLCWRAKQDASEGKIDDAFDDALACYRAGMHLKGHRTLIEQLVGIAMENFACNASIAILHGSQIDSRKLQCLQNELEKNVIADTFTVSFEIERFSLCDFVQRCFTDDGKGSGHFIPTSMKSLGSGWELGDSSLKNYVEGLKVAITIADRRKTMEKFDAGFNEAELCAKMTPWKKNQDTSCVSRQIDWNDIERTRFPFYYLLMPAVNKVIELSYRNRIQCEATIATFAIVRYKQDKGDYPETLNQLVAAGYLKQVPMDPWSDKPLVYKKTDNDFILYSVGANFVDDGGVVYYDKSGKPQVWSEKGGDAVFWPVPKEKSNSKK